MADRTPIVGELNGALRVSETLPAQFLMHRVVFVVCASCLLLVAATGMAVDPLSMPVLAGLIILTLGVPHGAFDVAVWKSRNGSDGSKFLSTMLLQYVLLASIFLMLWILAPAVALPAFIVMSIYHFSGDWERDLAALPRLVVGGAIISAPAGLHRAEVIEIFSWLAPEKIAEAVGLIMATAAAPLLQATAVIVVLLGFRRPWAAAELAVILSLAWVTPPLLFFLVYFCGLHSVRHMIETRHLLNTPTPATFLRMAFPYAPLAISGVLAGAVLLSALPPGPALISTIFMALGALTVPHMIVVDGIFASPVDRADRRGKRATMPE